MRATTPDNHIVNVVYLETETTPIVLHTFSKEQDAWDRYLVIKELMSEGYIIDRIKDVHVGRVDVSDAVCKEIGDRFFADRKERVTA